MARPKPLILAILDGWGVAPAREGNAIAQAKTPSMDMFLREYPVLTLYASGNEVGLQFGEMGNSEVGHLNIGAGRVYYQTLPRINKTITDGSFFENPAFTQAAAHTKKHKSALHIIGLVSPGNVHASQEHCHALLTLAKQQKVKDVYVHVILDGRDTAEHAGIEFVKELQQKIKEIGIGQIASLSGRYYAMDRDNRWDRTEKAYRAIAEGVADQTADDPIAAIEASYQQEVYDEHFVPVVITKKDEPVGRIAPSDAAIFFNFREDRARQLTKAFVLPGFSKFDRAYIKDLFFVTMTEYEKEVPVVVAFPPVVVHSSLAEVISKAGMTQYHVAETEKYAHITYFLNGTVEEPFPGEERKIIPSPRVSSYDQAPEMSANEITKEVVRAIDSDMYDVIFLNYANADMVGHTGNIEAAIKGIEAVDRGLGQIADHALAKGGALLITADHGNAEEMFNVERNEKDKEHSNNPVPFIMVHAPLRGQAGPAGDPPEGDVSLLHPVGMLADVAPTILRMLELEMPPEMSGSPLM